MEKKIIFLGDSITAWNSELKNIENSENNMEKKIIFLGDSITAWNSELKNIENSENFGVPGFISRDIVWQLQGDDEETISGHTVCLMVGVNDIMMGISIEKTLSNIKEIIEMLKKRFEKIIFIETISGHTVCLMVGVNDIMMGISIEKTLSNIKEIIEMLKKRFEKIIFISVLPIDNVNMNKNIQKLNENIKNIERIEFLDVHNYFLNEHEMIDYKFTTDGTHLSNYGYEILNKEIFKII